MAVAVIGKRKMRLERGALREGLLQRRRQIRQGEMRRGCRRQPSRSDMANTLSALSGTRFDTRSNSSAAQPAFSNRQARLTASPWPRSSTIGSNANSETNLPLIHSRRIGLGWWPAIMVTARSRSSEAGLRPTSQQYSAIVRIAPSVAMIDARIREKKGAGNSVGQELRAGNGPIRSIEGGLPRDVEIPIRRMAEQPPRAHTGSPGETSRLDSQDRFFFLESQMSSRSAHSRLHAASSIRKGRRRM